MDFKIHRWFSLFLLLLPVLGMNDSVMCHAQTNNPDIYEHLVGHWVGFDDNFRDGNVHHDGVDIVITEEKNGTRVKMEYTYSWKREDGKTQVSQSTKFMTLDARKSQIDFRWKGDFSTSHYQADGLSLFAQTGMGTITATGPAPGPLMGSDGLFTLSLSANTLFYKWDAKTSGGYQNVSTFCLHRAGFGTSTNECSVSSEENMKRNQ